MNWTRVAFQDCHAIFECSPSHFRYTNQIDRLSQCVQIRLHSVRCCSRAQVLNVTHSLHVCGASSILSVHFLFYSQSWCWPPPVICYLSSIFLHPEPSIRSFLSRRSFTHPNLFAPPTMCPANKQQPHSLSLNHIVSNDSLV
jgi:hypothetical protein